MLSNSCCWRRIVPGDGQDMWVGVAFLPTWATYRHGAPRVHCFGWQTEPQSPLLLLQVAERTITDDLEYLIRHTVDPSKADYAVVTGVQVRLPAP